MDEITDEDLENMSPSDIQNWLDNSSDKPGSTNDNNEEDSDNSSETEMNQEENTSDNSEENTTSNENEEDITLESSDINYEESYKRILEPITSRGRQYNIESLEKARSLMEKGVDYTRKTQELAENRRYIKMLERNNLLDENKLSLLIDISNGDTKAIKKLIKDSKIDAYSLTDDAQYDENGQPIEDEYIPGRNIIPPQQARLEELLDTYADSKNFDKVRSDLLKWDEESKKHVFLENRFDTYIPILAEHAESGKYEEVMKHVNYLSDNGLVNEKVPSIALYRQIYAQLYGNEAFSAEEKALDYINSIKPIGKSTRPTKPGSADYNKIKQTKNINEIAQQGKKSKSIDDLSDEEFLKNFDDLIEKFNK